MNLETNLPDPQLKYKTGILKGRPLDSAPLNYNIVRRNGVQVAQFTNGAVAEFYRELGTLPRCESTMTERLSPELCIGQDCGTYVGNLGPCRAFEEGSNGRCVYCDHAKPCHPLEGLLEDMKTRRHEHGARTALAGEKDLTETTETYRRIVVENPAPVTLAPLNDAVMVTKQKKITIGKVRRAYAGDGDPIYVVMEGDKTIARFNRIEVGHGLREFLWLYERFRDLGRGRVMALWETYLVYGL